MQIGPTLCFFLLLISSVSSVGQQRTPSANVSFALELSGANPSHYEITVGDDGKGLYKSNGQIEVIGSTSSVNSPQIVENAVRIFDPVEEEALQFTLSENIRARIFELSQQAHYFNGKVDSGRKNIANTGAKTLTYKDAQHNGQATYNYSQLAPVRDLTSIFEGLSITLEFGRRLSYFRKYEKLALEAELKRMEEMQRDKSLGDLQSIGAVLNDIANDTSVMNVARARALRLLAATGK